ncbi:hypothetical protein COV53_02990 [Candidatus Gottesmanbacteria bacterium CG11_big_fil_rev_8_21_14_0_20_37_11]|uniref:Uncharacterized protein n=1 Tax=Candidatus Gottesmanbacteria bacterium CG11_big_fil_rev_8_21_14_0_20_37_11 TaxID=1974575 RepID=A0A2H0NHT1_9BACT|nr:MAG: hypothetical protein COV53_02990 [Candidatus Gottesmanbacteria bacterium CG11_big_fil_rev_8_21_14_0_20_37_11]
MIISLHIIKYLPTVIFFSFLLFHMYLYIRYSRFKNIYQKIVVIGFFVFYIFFINAGIDLIYINTSGKPIFQVFLYGSFLGGYYVTRRFLWKKYKFALKNEKKRILFDIFLHYFYYASGGLVAMLLALTVNYLLQVGK